MAKKTHFPPEIWNYGRMSVSSLFEILASEIWEEKEVKIASVG